MYYINVYLFLKTELIYDKGVHIMILMDIKLHNLYAFKNFHTNFSYPKKIVNTTIKNEYLKDFTNFRYKKVNILMGANASGKTTFGKAIIALFNFMQRNNPSLLISSANIKNEPAKIECDFVEEDNNGKQKLFRLKLRIENEKDPIILSSLNSVEIRKRDNYEICAKKLDKMKYTYTKDSVTLFDEISQFGWYFSETDSRAQDESNKKGDEVFIKVLNLVMQTFDTFITSVKQIEDDSNSILIKFSNGESVIYHDGTTIGPNDILSKGTDSSIVIAEIITNVILKRNGFYYIDEKICFVQSDLEKSILSLLIELLGKNQQLFFTTHNTDVLDLNIPKHSYAFFKKNSHDFNQPIEIISASSYLKKQDDSLRNAVENDLFSIGSNDSKILEIMNLIDTLA